jgi:hypothetical protein
MRFLIPALFVLPFASCVSTQPLRSVPPVAIPVTEENSPLAAASPAPVMPVPAAPAKAASRQISGITFNGVAFDSRNHRLVVVDQPDGPGSLFADAASAARARGGVAGINAGFFTPEGEPLGWVLGSGKISGSWNTTSSLGSGVWHAGPSGISAISRRDQLGRNAAKGMSELIQAGPLLVENGRAVGGLEASKNSARSIILWDGGTRWYIGCSSPCTLDALARALAQGQPAGWPVRHALNLDGGRSSDFWVSSSVSGGPVSQRPPWNRPVRNFLVLLEK